jgi:hypothetical protein
MPPLRGFAAIRLFQAAGAKAILLRDRKVTKMPNSPDGNDARQSRFGTAFLSDPYRGARLQRFCAAGV